MSAFDLESEARAIADRVPHRISCPSVESLASYDLPCNCVVERTQNALAAAILALVRRKVEREREACEVAVCERCASGHKPSMSKDFGREMHLLQGYPPRECKAAAIRARRQP